jgi:hypothetical protein
VRCDISATTNGHTHIRTGKRWRIIDTIAHHGHTLTACAHVHDNLRLPARGNARMNLLNANLGGDPLSDTLVIS